MRSTVTDAPRNTLVGWKTIGEYLGKDARTAMRWKRSRGLPVHAPSGERGSVYADPGELDAWLRGSGANAAGAADSHDPHRTDDRGEPHNDGPSAAAATPSATPRVARALSARSGIVLGIAAVAVLLLGISVWSSHRGGEPARAAYSAGRLSAWDDGDRLLWTQEIPQQGRTPEERVDTQVADLDGDGSSEVLAFVVSTPPLPLPDRTYDELICLSSTGRVLWRHRPQRTLRFSGRSFDGPWYVSDMLVVAQPAGRASEVWLTVNHRAFWPAFVERIDPTGRATLAFVNSGSLYALNALPSAVGAHILVGGRNEEYGAAALAVLGADALGVSSPQGPASVYAVEGQDERRPLRYFVLPRSELNRLAGAPNHRVVDMLRSGDGIGLTIKEGPPEAPSLWSLSRDLRFDTRLLSDGYWDHHRHLEAAGRLSHAPEQCPDARGPSRIRAWEPATGWVDVELAPKPGVFWPGSASLGRQ